MIWILLISVIVLCFGVIAFRGAPYVPSIKKDVERVFTELYPLSKKDTLVDVGSGDGKVLRIASQHGAKAVGYELNPILVIISRILSRRSPGVSVKFTDFWTAPLPDSTTVVYGFLVTRDVKKMTRKMQDEATRLNRPIRYISYGSSLTDVTPDKSVGASKLYTFFPLQTDKAQV